MEQQHPAMTGNTQATKVNQTQGPILADAPSTLSIRALAM